MRRCANCVMLDYYIPSRCYEKLSDGHRCGMAGGTKVNIYEDEERELKNASLQHTCTYIPVSHPVQLELDFK